MPRIAKAVATLGIAIALTTLLFPAMAEATLVARTVFAEEFGYRT